jgi:cytochrome c6
MRVRSVVRAGVAAAVAAVAFPALAADTIKGGETYARLCANCHGQNGRPVMPGAPNLTRVDTLMRPDAVLMQSVRAGRNAMPGFQGMLRDTEILDVIAYLRTLQR